MKIQVVDHNPSLFITLFYNNSGRVILGPGFRSLFTKEARYLEGLFKAEQLDPEKEAVSLLYAPNGTTILACGLGKESKPDLRSIGANVGKKAIGLKTTALNIILPTSKHHPLFTGFELFLEGFLLGNYQYKEFKTAKKDEPTFLLEEISIQGPDKGSLDDAITKAQVKAESTNLARNFGNKPGNYFTPTHFRNACESVSKEANLKFYALDEAQMKVEKMGCLLGVSQGSAEPAFLSALEYHYKKDAPTLLLVGKGLTFDAGGISIKPSAGMEEMKWDMCGGAGVLGAMRIIGLLKPEINVIGLIPASENLPSSRAVKPGDILTACNGKTVEIINTDAEGRLILADALAYGVKKYQPDAVIDMATLTGACMVALGSYHSGMLGNKKELKDQVRGAAAISGDPVWELPNHKNYRKQIEGSISDLLNAGGREAGTITAAQFLEEFVDETPWVHLDIAGTGWNADRIPYYPAKGATGTGTRLLAELALNWKS